MVFISYSSKDYEAAHTIKTVLESNGVSCWMAPESIPGGADYSSAIPDAIESCAVFLLVLSGNAQASNWVPKELDLAITCGKTVIPFQIDGGLLLKPFNFRLTNIQRIEAFHNLEDAYSELLSRIGTETGTTRSDLTISELPAHYSYYEMLGIQDISQLSIQSMRERADVTASLSVPIGINASGEIVHLDLHQKGDGPHGLIIGPAGSGKSEFLLTLCLSLSLFFPPEEVRLHVIDLKNGGIVNELAGLPHLGECLVDFSDEAVKRFIDSIEDEVQQRYRILEEHSVSNIYQYLELRKKAESPMRAMPHLVIAIDELSLFKREYPGMLAKIKAWGSKMNAALLGVHVIFSTKYYDGAVDDSIWQMCDFKICSSMLRDKISAGGADDVSRCPGRLYMQSRSRSKVQLLQLAYCRSEIIEEEITRYGGFFLPKSEKYEVIDLLKRFQMD